MIRLSSATTVLSDISKSARERDQSASQALASSGFNQRYGNRSAVSQDGIDAINAQLRSGFESYRGGHQVQQRTYEPEVDRVELTGRIRSINDNNKSLSLGSAVQIQARQPAPAAEMLQAAKSLVSELQSAPAPARATQAAQLSRAGAEKLLQ